MFWSGFRIIKHEFNVIRLVFRLEADDVFPEPAKYEVFPLELGRRNLAPAEPLPAPGRGPSLRPGA